MEKTLDTTKPLTRRELGLLSNLVMNGIVEKINARYQPVGAPQLSPEALYALEAEKEELYLIQAKVNRKFVEATE